MNRALPGHYVDLIRDGAKVSTRSRGDIEVYNALVQTAMSAVQRGWSFAEWYRLVMDPPDRGAIANKLAEQACRRHSNDRTRSHDAVQRSLRKAWLTAERQTALSPPTTPQEARQEAAEVQAFAANPDATIPDVWRAILAHAATIAHQEGTIRPALPRDKIVAATGYGHRTVRTALAKLDACGLLRVAVRGRAGIPKANLPAGTKAPPAHLLGRATLYRLPSAVAMTAHLCPVNGQVGPLAQTSRTPAFPADLDPSHTSRTPDTQEGLVMATVTLPGNFTYALPAELAAAVNHFLETGQVQAIDTGKTPAPTNVVPLRATDRRSA